MQIDCMEAVLQQFPRAGFVIAGSGSQEAQIRAHLATKPYAGQILLYGDMPHAVTLRATLDSDVLLRATLYDGDSISVREALYLGTPVIATDNGIRPAGVRLVPISDPNRLAETIVEVLSKPGSRKPPAGDGQENMREVFQ